MKTSITRYLQDYFNKTRRRRTHFTPDFDIVIVVLHRGDSKWMDRWKNTSATTIGCLPREDSHNPGTILIRHRNQDIDVTSVQKTPVNRGVSVNEPM
jgi:hypothetical protein